MITKTPSAAYNAIYDYLVDCGLESPNDFQIDTIYLMIPASSDIGGWLRCNVDVSKISYVRYEWRLDGDVNQF